MKTPITTYLFSLLISFLFNNEIQGQCIVGSRTSLGPIGTPPLYNGGAFTTYNGTGRISDIEFLTANKNEMYLGTHYGAMWHRNEIIGTSSIVTGSEHLYRSGVSDIEVTASNRILLGTGTPQGPFVSEDWNNRVSTVGIYYSDDAGLTFTPSNICGESGYSTFDKTKNNNWVVAKLLVHPTNANIAYALFRKAQWPGDALTNLGKFFKSTDGGANWLEISTPGLVTDKYFWDMEFALNNADKIFITSRSVYQYTVSTDTWLDLSANLNGLSLSNTSAEDRLLVETAAEGSGSAYNDFISFLAYGLTGAAIYKSTNLLTSTISGATPSTLTAATFNKYRVYFEIGHNYSHVYVGGNVFKYSIQLEPIDFNTQGYGKLTHPDINGIAVPPYDGTNEDAVYIATDGGLYRSYDGGVTLEEVNDGLANHKFFDISYAANRRKLIGGAQDVSSSMFLEGNWYWIHPYSGDGNQVETNQDVSSTHYTSNYLSNGTIERSTNNGNTGTLLGSDGVKIHTIFPNGPPMRLAPSNQDVLYAGYEKVYKSISGAAFTSLIQQPKYIYSDYNLITDVEVFEQDENLVIIACTGNWVDALGNTSDDSPSTTEPNYNDPTGRKINELFIFESGLWTDISPEITGVYGQITSVAISDNNPDLIWVTYNNFESNAGVNQNVFMTTDGGTNWSAYSEGLPKTSTSKVLYERKTDDRLYLATDEGVYFRDNTMSAWECYNNQLPSGMILDIEVDYCGGKLGVSIYNKGVWESIPPASDRIDYVLNSNEVWSTDRNIITDIYIPAGYTLTINAGATINIAKDKAIKVERGGRLIIDNATVTNMCQELWQGIEVWGNSS